MEETVPAGRIGEGLSREARRKVYKIFKSTETSPIAHGDKFPLTFYVRFLYLPLLSSRLVSSRSISFRSTKKTADPRYRKKSRREQECASSEQVGCKLSRRWIRNGSSKCWS